ncbi:MAG: Transcriptional regulator of heat shock protein [Parcubacteria group bacterium GW2011_GWA2_43_17]|nr:MAG: Transcriptional regulator of heat shock protein [Parcubacteria group bacterium GW2011_GWA2_43_17]
MNSRQEALLSQIIKKHFKSASPVGSKFLEEKSRLGVSSATIRNEMAFLEQEGYVTHPHTSAGRLPTEKGYRYYLDHLIKESFLSPKDQQALQDYLSLFRHQDFELLIRQLAKKMAEVSHNTVVIGFAENNVYYTGVANLLSQPEFNDPHCIYDMGLVIDHLDNVMEQIFSSVGRIQVLIGSQNPFGNQCSVVLGPWHRAKQQGILGILGPMRMDYEKNLGLVKFFGQII